MQLPVVRAVMRVKYAILFRRIAADPQQVRSDYMTSSKNKNYATDPFSSSFSVTFGPDNNPVNPEFKLEIGLFMMDALHAIDAFGFVPWMVSQIRPQTITADDRIFKIPRVPNYGLWRVHHALLGNSAMEEVWSLQPANIAAMSEGGGILDNAAQIDAESIERARAATTNAHGGTFEEASRRREQEAHLKKGYYAANRVPGTVTNQAHDYYATNGNGEPREYGIYVVHKPSIDGRPNSPAASVLAINDDMRLRFSYDMAATAVASNPMLVTTAPPDTAGGHQAQTAARSLLKRGDMTATNAVNRMSQNALDRAVERANDADQASSASGPSTMFAAGIKTYFDPLTGDVHPIVSRPFYENNKYDLMPGRTIVSQPMPAHPPALMDMKRYFDEQTAVQFGVTYAMAVLGDVGHITAAATINSDVVRKVVEMDGARVAAVTQWILNEIFQASDTQEMTQQIKTKQERRDATADIGEREYLDAEIDMITRYREMPARFQVRFSETIPTPEEIAALTQRGLLSREQEAAMLGAAVGIESRNIELQSGPNRYEKATLEATAKAKANANPKPGGPGAK